MWGKICTHKNTFGYLWHNVNMGNNIMDICARMVELRKENGFTQQYVAEYLQIDRSNYSKYELGKLEINIHMVIALSKLYKVSTDYILCQTDY